MSVVGEKITAMTQWAYLRFGDWSMGDDNYDAVTDRVCEFLGSEDPVQVIMPASGSWDAGKAMLGWIGARVRLSRDSLPVKVLVHPDRAQLDAVIGSGLPGAERVLVVLWSPEPAFEGWARAQGGYDLAAEDGVGDTAADPVVVEALRGVPLNNGLGGSYGGDRLVEALQALHAAGYDLSGPSLETAGGAVGMDLDDLRHVREHADRILKGRPFRLKQKSYRDDVVEVWKKHAHERADETEG